MPVHLLASAVSSAVPTEYWASIAASLVAISFLKTWSRGVKLLDPPPPTTPSPSNTNPAPAPPSLDAHLNDMHGRVVLVASGAFTPLGVVTISALAHRGAQIIALTPDISSPDVVQLVHLIRDSTQSELVYAEQCDIASLESISAFAALWNAGDKKQQHGIRRLDSLIFLPPSREEVRTLQATGVGRAQAIYQLHVLARFHLVNSLLSSLLLLPPEREVRIVSVVSPFYAAGANHFDVLATSTASPSKAKATPTVKTLAEGSYSALVGAASLRWYALSIELQRRLDLLAEADPRPRTKLAGIDLSSARPTAATPHTHSNIAVLNVCPGFERNADIIDTFLPAPSPSSFPPLYFARVALRMVLVLVVWPVVWLLAKSAATAANSVVWATARKLDAQARTHPILNNATPATAKFGLYQPLVPAELYREARIVRPTLPPRLDLSSKDARHNWAHLWQHEEHILEQRVKAKGGKIKRPQV